MFEFRQQRPEESARKRAVAQLNCCRAAYAPGSCWPCERFAGSDGNPGKSGPRRDRSVRLRGARRRHRQGSRVNANTGPLLHRGRLSTTRVGWPGGIVGSTRRRNDAIQSFRGAVRSVGGRAAEITLTNEGSLGASDAMPRFLPRSWMDRARRTCFCRPPRRRFRGLHATVLARRPPRLS